MSYQEPRERGKSGESDAPDMPVPVERGSQVDARKDKPPPRKKRGDAEKLLADQIGRPKQRASAKEKVNCLSRCPYAKCDRE